MQQQDGAAAVVKPATEVEEPSPAAIKDKFLEIRKQHDFIKMGAV